MYRINQKGLSAEQKEIMELVEHIDESGIYNNAQQIPMEFKRDLLRRSLDQVGIRERVEKYVYYPEMSNPILGIDGVDSAISSSRYWRGLRSLGSVQLRARVCSEITFFEQMDGNGTNFVIIDPLALAISSVFKDVSIFDMARQEPLTHRQSVDTVTKMVEQFQGTPQHS